MEHKSPSVVTSASLSEPATTPGEVNMGEPEEPCSTAAGTVEDLIIERTGCGVAFDVRSCVGVASAERDAFPGTGRVVNPDDVAARPGIAGIPTGEGYSCRTSWRRTTL
jgi:hypothetical protein